MTKARDLADGTFSGDVTVSGNITSTGIDDNATSTAMTLDSSDNLLVGTTSSTIYANSGASGIAVRGDGLLGISRDGNAAAVFNRNTSDGDIVQFRKSGTSVGSIGTTSGDLGIGTGDCGIKFVDQNETIYPANPSSSFANNDATVSLGVSTNRFKDLYLSGGVYVGGTGSANYLDDYEEGTWTPEYTTSANAFSSVTYDTNVTGGRYTKIGSTVFITGSMYTDGITVGSASGSVRITNLPFVVANSSVGQNSYNAIYVGESSNFAGDQPSSGRTIPASYEIDLFYRTAANGAPNALLVSDMGTAGNDNLIRFACFYTTT